MNNTVSKEQSRSQASARKVFITLLLASVALGVIFSNLPESVIQGHSRDFSEAATKPSYLQQENYNDELDHLFRQAAKRTAEGDNEAAVGLWHHVISRYPQLPEAHVNLGFALVNLGRYDAAQKSFNTALELRPQQANAYWGLALVYEAQDKLPEAIGAMRAFIHLSADADFNNRARAAMWEWQAKLESNDARQAAEKKSNN